MFDIHLNILIEVVFLSFIVTDILNIQISKS